MRAFLALAAIALVSVLAVTATADATSNHGCDKAWWPKSPNPAKKQYVPNAGSLQISGAACPGKGLTIVALTYGTGVHRYYVSGSATPSADGNWKILLKHIGSKKDLKGSQLKIFVRGVSDRCITAINGIRAMHGVQSFTSRPKGCSRSDWANPAVFTVVES